MILSTPTLKRKATRLCDYFPTIRRLFFDYLIFWYVVESFGVVWWRFCLVPPAFPQVSSLPAAPAAPAFPRCSPGISGYYSINYSINAFKIKIKAFFKALRLTLYIYIALIKTLKKRPKNSPINKFIK